MDVTDLKSIFSHRLVIVKPKGEHSDIRHTRMSIRYFWVKSLSVFDIFGSRDIDSVM